MCSKCAAPPALVMSRRNFLKLSGAGITGAFVLGIMGSGQALAQAGPLSSEFDAAAEKYGVPVELLLAAGYVNARWVMPPVATGDYEPGDLHGMGGYGIMQLRQDPEEDSLSRAASLTGISEEDLKNDRASNILGGAAVLATLGGEPKPTDLNGWYDAVADFGDGSLYANQVYETLQDGASAEVSGEELTLAPRPEVEPQQTFTAQATGDYSGSTWYRAYSGNYSNASRPSSNPINKVVIHVVQGSWSSAINWFRDSRAGVSAHYTVRSSDGFIGQSVREEDIAYHAGYWSYNQTSIGIEHEGYVSDPGRWFTDAMYRSSARLTAYLCKKYRIPIDRSHIIGHYEVPGCSGPGGGSGCHTDPGSGWNWTKYMDYVRSYAGASEATSPGTQIVDNTTPGRFRAPSKWTESSFSGQRYGANYRALLKPLSVNKPAQWKVKIPRRGSYTIYGWWSANAGYTARATYRIRTANGTVNRTVNQRKNGGRWVSLGTYEMAAGDRWYVGLSSKSTSSGYIIADAIKVVKR